MSKKTTQERLESHRPMLEFLREVVAYWKMTPKERRAHRDMKKPGDLF